jgi:DNA-directed RNA polymerase specialized sigma24 family protein
MLYNKNYTTMGGINEDIPTICWDIPSIIRGGSEKEKQKILNELIDRYWKPIYSYLRKKGHSDADAKDLTQDFLFEVFYGNNLVLKADSKKGKFRAFLIKSLQYFTADSYDKKNAKKNRPEGKKIISFETSEAESFLETTNQYMV